MRVFLCYASEDRAFAEQIDLALRAQGHDVFFDRDDLPAGEEYDIRIRRGIEQSHLFIFLVSPEAVDAGSYSLTELDIARKTWEHPTGRLLPVVLRPVALELLPPYLKSVTLLETEGNVPAAVADAVHRIARARRRRVVPMLVGGLAVIAVGAALSAVYLRSREPGQTTTGSDGAPATLVAADTLVMGDGEESPIREVYVDGFYLDEQEVTVARYAEFMRTTPLREAPAYWHQVDTAQDAQLPVIGVDWQDAHDYCEWAGRRLPTEAEWEKAARGTDGRRYPWGNEEPTPTQATFGRTASGPYDGGLTPVGSHAAGRAPSGTHDMAGNAYEWLADWYAEGMSAEDVRNPQGPTTGTAKVLRGGGWYDPPERLKTTRRMYADPADRFDDLGFRCARDLAR